MVYCIDAMEGLNQLPEGFVQCVVTSPPYWGLRDYGVDGQIGLENTPDEYVSKLVKIFKEVKRVLKPDGTFWLNLGDTYFGSNCGYGDYRKNISSVSRPNIYNSKKKPQFGSGKPKDLAGIPWMVAFALQRDGWYLRQDIIWCKPNPMPESVKDRCTKSHEYIFLFTRNKKYFFDHKTIRELANYDGRKDTLMKGSLKYKESAIPYKKEHSLASSGHQRWQRNVMGEYLRNKRSVWTIPTKPFKGAHFATFPPDLIRPCILAGSREGDIVLDPFMGSGTTASVAYELGRRYIGFEINPDYIELCNKRLKQTSLFGERAFSERYAQRL